MYWSLVYGRSCIGRWVKSRLYRVLKMCEYLKFNDNVEGGGGEVAEANFLRVQGLITWKDWEPLHQRIINYPVFSPLRLTVWK